MHGVVAPALDSPPLRRYGLPEWKAHASPAAGADFSYQLPGDYYVRLIALHCKFVASADAASREVVVSYEDAGSNRYALAGINTTVTAGLTAYYDFNVFQPEAIATVDGGALVPLSPIILLPTQIIKVHVVNMDNTDALSDIRTIWERFYATGPLNGPGPTPDE